MKRGIRGKYRTIGFVLIIIINVCPAVFIPTGIGAARKSILKSLDTGDLRGFNIQMEVSYPQLLRLKTQNDNIDYLFTITPYIMSTPAVDEANKQTIYNEYSFYAIAMDDVLLGSLKKNFVVSGRNFTPADQIDGNNVILMNSSLKQYPVGGTIKICPQDEAFLCRDFKIIGTFKPTEKIQCEGILPPESMKLFKKNSYWRIASSEMYGAVIDPIFIMDTFNEVSEYLQNANKTYTMVYGINANRYKDTIKSLNQLSILSVIIYVFLLFAASFGIINYIVVSLSERKIEIAVYMVAGCPRWKLVLRLAWQYFYLCAIGVIIGLAIAMILNLTFLKNMLQYQFSYFNASIDVFIGISLVSLLMSFTVCTYASSVIASKPPAELLRAD